MIEGFPYKLIFVSGIVHWALGICGGALAMVGMLSVNYPTNIFRIYCMAALFSSMLIVLVGSLGTSAGRKKLEDVRVRKLRTAYMVTSILSSCVFSLVGLAVFCYMFTVASTLEEKWSRFITVGQLGSAIMGTEFVAAIVSSSICCCCAK